MNTEESPSSLTQRPGPQDRPPDTDLVEWSRWVGIHLSSAFARLVEAMPLESRRPRDIGKCLGVNRDISGRLLALISTGNAFLSLSASPGPEPLRKVARAAEQLGVPEQLLADARAMIDEFNRLIEEGAGTRRRLETSLALMDADLRGRADLAGKHAIFTGQAQLQGVQADAVVHATIVSPDSAGGSWIDAMIVEGLIGIQRFRPGVVIHSSSHRISGRSGSDDKETVVERSPFDANAYAVNTPNAVLEEPDEHGMQRLLADAPLGRAGVRDSLALTVFRRVLPRSPSIERPERAVSGIATVPAAVMTLDVLLHQDLAPRRPPVIRVYNMKARGEAYIHDRSRDRDVMDTLEKVEPLGRGDDAWHNEDFPRHAELLGDLISSQGGRPEDYTCYRLRVAYPVMNWQYSMIFETR